MVWARQSQLPPLEAVLFGPPVLDFGQTYAFRMAIIYDMVIGYLYDTAQNVCE